MTEPSTVTVTIRVGMPFRHRTDCDATGHKAPCRVSRIERGRVYWTYDNRLGERDGCPVEEFYKVCALTWEESDA